MTYSIVARDAETGALGVGVQTHQPAVGAIVPWVKAGAGAVATQSFANVNFGPQGLALLEHGLDAPRTLAALIAGDAMPARRQVAVIDGNGAVAVHTGGECIPFASHVLGEGFAAQANMMIRQGVPEAMADAYTSATGVLAARIMAALDAAQQAGGDIRGSQSAAILVRAPGGPGLHVGPAGGLQPRSPGRTPATGRCAGRGRVAAGSGSLDSVRRRDGGVRGGEPNVPVRRANILVRAERTDGDGPGGRGGGAAGAGVRAWAAVAGTPAAAGIAGGGGASGGGRAGELAVPHRTSLSVAQARY